MNKLLYGLAVMCGAVVLAVIPAKTVKAEPLPCTVTYLEQAKAQKAAADAELVAAQADFAAKQQAYNAIKNTGSPLEVQQAADAMTNAQNMVAYKQSRVADAQTFINNVMQKWQVEDAAYNAVNALHDLNAVQAALLNANNAQDIANTAAAAIKMVQQQIIGYQAMLATSPGLQTQINLLNAQLPALVADYEAKQADANAKRAVYLQSLNSNYANYNQAAIDYIYNRDFMRNYAISDLNNDGVIDGLDFFEGIHYMQNTKQVGGIFYNQYHWTQQPPSCK